MYKSIKVADFLHRVKVPVELQAEQEYSLVTIKVHHRGVVLRNKTKGSLIGSKMHRISKGQFILSGIDARHGAFGIVPEELDGAIVTNDFWYFDIDETKVKRDFFYWLTNTPIFLNACIKSSQGVTQRVRLQAKLFFDFEFRFPSLEEQEDFLKRIQHADQGLNLLKAELNNQEKYISQLKQAILQEAIAGQLTADWRKQNPMQKGNPDTDAASLLAKIKAEKQQLIADGKLKKENPLAEIAVDEIPFFIPESWVWCRGEKIGEYIDPQPSHRTPPEVSDGIPYISMKDIKNGIISLITARKVSYKILEEHKERYQLRNGDFIIGKIGTIGNPVWLHLPQDYTISANLVLIQPNSNIIPKIMFFILASNYCDNHMKEVKSEMSYPVFGIKKMRLMPFPLPPLAEQKAIVEKVNKLMNIIDQLEQQIKHRKQLAEALMQTVLREAFE